MNVLSRYPACRTASRSRSLPIAKASILDAPCFLVAASLAMSFSLLGIVRVCVLLIMQSALPRGTGMRWTHLEQLGPKGDHLVVGCVLLAIDAVERPIRDLASSVAGKSALTFCAATSCDFPASIAGSADVLSSHMENGSNRYPRGFEWFTELLSVDLRIWRRPGPRTRRRGRIERKRL